MKKIVNTIALLIILTATAYSQASPIGIWKNIDDEDGKVKSHLEIYEKGGKLEAKVVKLLDNATVTVCEKCKGDKKNKPLINMVIMWGMEPDGDNEWDSGKIMDPKSGKEYKCKIALNEDNKLKVRGYVGMSAFGRTQYWYRLEQSSDTQ